MPALLGKQYLLDALKKASQEHPSLHIPCTYRSLLRLEKAGIVPPCNARVKMTPNLDCRMYSQEEIDLVVQKVVEHYSQKKGHHATK